MALGELSSQIAHGSSFLLALRLTGQWLTSAGLEITCDRIEQLATGCELALLASDQVLEATGECIGLRIAAIFNTYARRVGYLDLELRAVTVGRWPLTQYK